MTKNEFKKEMKRLANDVENISSLEEAITRLKERREWASAYDPIIAEHIGNIVRASEDALRYVRAIYG